MLITTVLITTVYISPDCSTLGADATELDLERYAKNLANHLGERFPGRRIDVDYTSGIPQQKCPADDEINEYVTELEAGDGWLDLLD